MRAARSDEEEQDERRGDERAIDALEVTLGAIPGERWAGFAELLRSGLVQDLDPVRDECRSVRANELGERARTLAAAQNEQELARWLEAERAASALRERRCSAPA